MNLADLMIAPFDASHRLDFDRIQILNRNCYDALTDAPGIGGRSAVWRTLRALSRYSAGKNDLVTRGDLHQDQGQHATERILRHAVERGASGWYRASASQIAQCAL